ncbi:Hydroxycinnamoyl-Coenzyme A shikimate/quinate hydroxycinnamoyltransferase [Glycine soja]|nr:Hydroxycinnamoyl-Coenzyme A shikimate/quinate hydroxycinnamoyltransferase [Glycine soja]
MNRWAKLTRGEAQEPNEIPFLDRTLLKLPHQPSAPSVKLPEWKPAPKIPGKEQTRSAALLELTSNQVQRLKEKANDQSSKEGSRPYSRFEVVAAHIWRCAAKARESGENHPTVARFSVDFRKRLNPPLPQNFFGNALAKAVTPKCYERDIISNPLSFAAQKIREGAHAVTDEYIRSQLNVILGQQQLDQIRAFFKGQGHRLNVPYAGDHNILLTSWITMPLYEADFGWGKPVLFGLATRFQEDRAAILPNPEGYGVTVSIFFQTTLMQLFKTFFYEDM